MKRIIIDASKCDGCLNCNIACMQSHRKDEGTLYTLDLANPCNETRNYILLNDKKQYKPLFCRHCAQPECVVACMSGAMTKNALSGIVEYDETKCGSCLMCVMNCPFGVLKTDATHQSIIKCDLCQHLDSPSCVAACPKEALTLKEVKQ